MNLAIVLMGDSVKKSFAVRYGGPVGVGLLVGVVWGMNKVTSHLEHLVYDLPSSPLTAIYRKKLYVTFCAKYASNSGLQA